MLPAAVKADLSRHLEVVRRPHQLDLARGAGWVELPQRARPELNVALEPAVNRGACDRPGEVERARRVRGEGFVDDAPQDRIVRAGNGGVGRG